MKDSKNNVTDLNLVKGIISEEKAHMYLISKEEKMRLNEIKKGDQLTEDDILNSRTIRQSIMNNPNLGKKQPKSKEEIESKIEFLNNNINKWNKMIEEAELLLKERYQIKKNIEGSIEDLKNLISEMKDNKRFNSLLLNVSKKDLEELEGDKNE